MDSRDDTRTPPAGSPFYEASFIQSASSPASVLMVRIDAFGDAPFGDPDGVVWSPLGNALPAAGDRCLVAESDDGSWWVLSWASEAQAGPDSTIAGRWTVNGSPGLGTGTFDTLPLVAASEHAPAGMSMASNTVTIPADGWYFITGFLQINPTTTPAALYMSVAKQDGTSVLLEGPGSSTGLHRASGAAVRWMPAGETLRLQGFCSTASGVVIQGALGVMRR